MDLLARVAATVRAHAAEPKRVGDETAARGRLGKGTERGERPVTDGERRRIRDHLGARGDAALRLHEAEPVPRADAQRADGVGAARRNSELEANDDPLVSSERETAIGPPSRYSGAGAGWLDAFIEKEARLDPRQRDPLAVRDLERRDGLLARDQAVRIHHDPSVDGGKREPSGHGAHQAQAERSDGEHDDGGFAERERGDHQHEGERPGESSGER